MKDFLEWLEVNEKIAKLVIWLFIIMIFLIITNTLLESIGLPYYKITVDNLQKIDTNKIFEYIASYLITLLNFYSVIFLVFRVKEFKGIFLHSIIYLTLNIITYMFLGYIANQIFIIVYVLIFCYLYSGKKSRFIVYGVISYIINVIVQYIWYLSKARHIDFSSINNVTQFLLSIDFFTVMIVVIFVKEIYLKKRSGINGS